MASEKGVRKKIGKLEVVSISLIALAVLCDALMTTFYIYDIMFAVLALMSLAFLFGGIGCGLLVHGLPDKNNIFALNYNTFFWGSLGVALLAAAQFPLVLMNLSIYNLAVLDPLGIKLFLFAQAVAEECFFAYFLYSYFRKISFPAIGNFACATIFMIMHAAVYNVSTPVLLVVFVSRIILNIIYDLGGLGSSMFAHVIVNLVAGG